MPRRIDFAIVAIAVAARVAAVLALQSHLTPRSTYEHGTIAANLLSGKGFAIKFLGAFGPTSQQAPVYPCIVALAYAVGGVETPASLLILELGQAFLGGALALATILLTRELIPGRRAPASLAGLLVAVHPTLIYSATHVQVAGLAALLLTLVLLLAARSARSGKTRDVIASGLALGTLLLTDPILGLCMPALTWLFALRNGMRQALRFSTQVLAIAALTIAPWIVRNYRVHGEFVPVKSTFGYAFWQGNCAISEGTDKVARGSIDDELAKGRSAGWSEWNRTLWRARHVVGYIDDIALTKSDLEVLGKLSEPARSRALFRRALDDLANEPGRYARLCWRRLRYFALFDETNPKSRSLVYRIPHVLLSALALAGLCLAPSSIRRNLAPTALTVALIALFHSLTIVSARFHVPIEPILAVWSGSLAAVRGRRSSSAVGDVEGVGVIRGLRGGGVGGRGRHRARQQLAGQDRAANDSA